MPISFDVVKIILFTTIEIRWHQIPLHICSSLLWVREKRTCGIESCIDFFPSSIFVVVGKGKAIFAYSTFTEISLVLWK